MPDNISTIAQETFLRYRSKLNELFQMDRANMDQHYIKTFECLRDYHFFLDPVKTLRMTFRLVEGMPKKKTSGESAGVLYSANSFLSLAQLV